MLWTQSVCDTRGTEQQFLIVWWGPCCKWSHFWIFNIGSTGSECFWELKRSSRHSRATVGGLFLHSTIPSVLVYGKRIDRTTLGDWVCKNLLCKERPSPMVRGSETRRRRTPMKEVGVLIGSNAQGWQRHGLFCADLVDITKVDNEASWIRNDILERESIYRGC